MFIFSDRYNRKRTVLFIYDNSAGGGDLHI